MDDRPRHYLNRVRLTVQWIRKDLPYEKVLLQHVNVYVLYCWDKERIWGHLRNAAIKKGRYFTLRGYFLHSNNWCPVSAWPADDSTRSSIIENIKKKIAGLWFI